MSTHRARMYIGGEDVGSIEDLDITGPAVLLPEGHSIEFVSTPMSREEVMHNRAVDLWRAMLEGSTASLNVMIAAINSAWCDGDLEERELVGLLARVGFDITRLVLSIERVDRIRLEGNQLKIIVADEKIPDASREYTQAPSADLVIKCGGPLTNTPAFRAASVSSGPGVSVDEADAAMAKLDEVI